MQSSELSGTDWFNLTSVEVGFLVNIYHCILDMIQHMFLFTSVANYTGKWVTLWSLFGFCFGVHLF